MKRGRLRQSLVYLIIGLVVFAFINVSWADGVKVEVPYAVTNAQWWTGVAIKNLDASSATDPILIEFLDQGGVSMGTVDIGSLEPLEIYSQTASTIYPGSLPVNYSIMISQPDSEELAVTVFVGNSETDGFAFQTYNSQACSQAAATPSWSQIIPGAERFELVMNEEAVLDRETGLVWERDASNTTYEWDDAVLYCYTANIGGRMGWRLPTVAELTTLVDRAQINPSLPTGHPFGTALAGPYWTITTIVADSYFAWIVSFYNGTVAYIGNNNPRYVRAVRSGQ